MNKPQNPIADDDQVLPRELGGQIRSILRGLAPAVHCLPANIVLDCKRGSIQAWLAPQPGKGNSTACHQRQLALNLPANFAHRQSAPQRPQIGLRPTDSVTQAPASLRDEGSYGCSANPNYFRHRTRSSRNVRRNPIAAGARQRGAVVSTLTEPAACPPYRAHRHHAASYA